MLFLIQLLIMVILILVLVTLYVDERKGRYQDTPVGKMTRYWNGKERRGSIRIDNTLSVRYTIEKKLHLVGYSLTKNVGEGGILIEINEKLLTETLLGLEIELPVYEKPITADGKVVWVKENPNIDQAGKRVFDTGIKFVHMEPDQKSLLLQYIKNSSS